MIQTIITIQNSTCGYVNKPRATFFMKVVSSIKSLFKKNPKKRKVTKEEISDFKKSLEIELKKSDMSPFDVETTIEWVNIIIEIAELKNKNHTRAEMIENIKSFIAKNEKGEKIISVLESVEKNRK